MRFFPRRLAINSDVDYDAIAKMALNSALSERVRCAAVNVLAEAPVEARETLHFLVMDPATPKRLWDTALNGLEERRFHDQMILRNTLRRISLGLYHIDVTNDGNALSFDQAVALVGKINARMKFGGELLEDISAGAITKAEQTKDNRYLLYLNSAARQLAQSSKYGINLAQVAYSYAAKAKSSAVQASAAIVWTNLEGKRSPLRTEVGKIREQAGLNSKDLQKAFKTFVAVDKKTTHVAPVLPAERDSMRKLAQYIESIDKGKGGFTV